MPQVKLPTLPTSEGRCQFHDQVVQPVRNWIIRVRVDQSQDPTGAGSTGTHHPYRDRALAQQVHHATTQVRLVRPLSDRLANHDQVVGMVQDPPDHLDERFTDRLDNLDIRSTPGVPEQMPKSLLPVAQYRCFDIDDTALHIHLPSPCGYRRHNVEHRETSAC